jgi:hypothetical protein
LLRYRPRKLGKLGVPGKPIPAKMTSPHEKKAPFRRLQQASGLTTPRPPAAVPRPAAYGPSLQIPEYTKLMRVEGFQLNSWSLLQNKHS